jgi:hypothetical protein
MIFVLSFCYSFEQNSGVHRHLATLSSESATWWNSTHISSVQVEIE